MSRRYVGLAVLVGILAVYLVAALLTLHAWRVAGFQLTGDEPHYLVIARGILVDHTLEQTAPYREAFQQGLFFGPGITDPPSPANTHAYLGPHGLFNIHSFGLPVLIAGPYAVAGVLGVKVFLVFVGAVGITFFWKISGVFTPRLWIRALSVAPVGIAMPLLTAANQIYPDIPAGVLCLVGLYWLLTAAKRRPLWQEILFGVAVAYLPLLQVKYAAPAVVLTASLAVVIARREPERPRALRLRRTAVVVVPFLAFMLGLFSFNLYAFGNLSGPYEAGAFRGGPPALMTFAGLIIDQNQGFLFQNVVGFVGLVAVGLLFRRNHGFTIVWVLVLLSILIPNALLSNQYGGFSFNGRFEYTAALVFSVATLYGLVRLAEARRALFVIVAALALGVQISFWSFYTFARPFLDTDGRMFYNPGSIPWLLNYSIFYYPLQNALPALYDDRWAFAFVPNYAWVVVVAALLAIGFWARPKRVRALRRVWMPALAGVAVFVVVAGVTASSPAPARSYPAASLVVAQGVPAAGAVSASAPTGQVPGVVTAGPIDLVREGTYTLSLTYSSTASPETVVGSWRAVRADEGDLPELELRGTGGAPATVVQTVELQTTVPRLLQVFTTWNGTADLTLSQVGVALADSADQ